MEEEVEKLRKRIKELEAENARLKVNLAAAREQEVQMVLYARRQRGERV